MKPRGRAAKQIDFVVFDIDGVLTDGSFSIEADGRERKSLRYRDLDALNAASARGLRLALLTAERGALADRVVARLNIARFMTGVRDKLEGLRALAAAEGLTASRVCFVGDSDRDAPALRWAGVGLAPADASPAARAAATRVLRTAGGAGLVPEVFAYLRRRSRLAKATR